MSSAVILFGLLALVWPAYSQTTSVSQCTRYGGDQPASALPIHTYIQGCSSPPCQLEMGSDAVINIVFRAPRTIHSLTTLAAAFLGPIPIPYPLGNEAFTCNFITNTYCPLLRDEVVQYTLRMPIETWMGEGTSAAIEFYIRDDSDRTTVACLRTSILIVAPLSGKSEIINQ